jgi:hypothetical protein
MSKVLFPVVCVVVFTLTGCVVEQPGEPSWEVELTIPVADRVYSLEEVISDSENVNFEADYVTISGDTLFLNFSDSLEPMNIADQITHDPINDIMQAEMGVRTIEDPGTETVDIVVIEPGVYDPFVPPFDFGPVSESPDPFPEYEWVILNSGEAVVTITNHLPLTLSQLDIYVYDTEFDELLLLELHHSDPLLPGESFTDTSALPAGAQISNTLRVELSGSSPGSAVPVEITTESNFLQADVTLRSLTVNSALAHIPPQSFFEDTLFAFQESDTAKKAVIKEGTLTYTITNETQLVTDATVELPDFSLNGESFSRTYQVPPQGQYTETIDLSGYEFKRDDQDNLIHGILNVDVYDSDYPPYPDPGTYIEIRSDQIVKVEFWVSEVVFGEFEGYLDERIIEIDQEPQYLEDIPEGLESLDVESADLDVQLTSIIGASVTLDITFEAYKNDALAETYVVNSLFIPPGSPQQPAVLDTTFEGLEALVNVLPDYIVPVGQATLGGQVDMEDWQWIEGKYRFYAPFYFAINDTTTLEPEITEYTDGFDNPVLQVDLDLEIINNMPVSGEAYLLASNDSLQFYDYQPGGEPVDTLLNAQLPTAIIGTDGYVSEPSTGFFNSSLGKSQIELFAEASEDHPLWVKTLVVLYPTTSIVRCLPQSSITVGASAHVVVTVGDSDN